METIVAKTLTAAIFKIFWNYRAMSTCRDSSNLLEAGRRPVRSQIPLRYPGRRQFRTSFEPDSVMEFGFNRLAVKFTHFLNRVEMAIFALFGLCQKRRMNWDVRVVHSV